MGTLRIASGTLQEAQNYMKREALAGRAAYWEYIPPSWKYIRWNGPKRTIRDIQPNDEVRLVGTFWERKDAKKLYAKLWDGPWFLRDCTSDCTSIASHADQLRAFTMPSPVTPEEIEQAKQTIRFDIEELSQELVGKTGD